ncbi:zinc metalloproteinase nas-13-like [Rhopilema esculentum]|uniref:zinc metalloproteinase nas-13-like n=1 Tax=Rhopilema esculentum TaxID=499914 RepID=UPI0031E04DB7
MLRFEEKKGENETLYFYRGKGCWSYVGYIPNKMAPISLGYGCWRKGIVIHEMAHALGFFHEQSRPDRDDYVTILWENIPKYFRNQFKKYTLKHIDSLNVPYDYLSIMHYNRHQFGGDKPTIDAKDPAYKYKIGQRNGLSEKDILQFGIMYNCPGFTRPPVTKGSSQKPTTHAPTKQQTTRLKTIQPTTKLSTVEPTSMARSTLKKTTTRTQKPKPTTVKTTPAVYYRQLLVCENRTRSFSCSFGSEVKVEYAMYGRQIGMYCRWGPVKSINCKVPDALQRVRALCEGKQYCKMQANDLFFGYDPCPGTFKYLEVRMGCMKKS